MHSDKAALRRHLLERRAELSPKQRLAAADRLIAQAEAIANMAGGQVVSGFWPIRDEIDPHPLLLDLHQRGVPLALPVVTREGLLFRAWRPGDVLVKAGFGLMEPDAACETAGPSLMLVPLLGFDRRGGRIGYGKGYYDGAIRRYRPDMTIGLAFACQEVEAIPMEAHDQRLFRVLTEEGLIDCRP